MPQVASSFDDTTLSALVDTLIATYRIDLNRIYVTGYGLGGGATWWFGTRHPTRAAALAPICGANYPSTSAQCAPLNTQAVWAFHCSDDSTVPTSWTTGAQSGFTPAWTGWISGTAVSLNGVTPNLCLDTHPDHPTVKTNQAGAPGCLLGVTATRTGHYEASTGWAWTTGTVATAGAKLQITIYFGGGHTGWTQTYGTTASDLNRTFWDWLLGQQKPPAGAAMGETSRRTGVDHG